MPFLNIVVPLNNEYMELIERLKELDTRSLHLKAFEVTLSYALGNDMLWTNENYKDMDDKFPLPEDPLDMMDFEVFRSRLVLYEGIMKEYHLLGTADQAAPVTGVSSKYLDTSGGTV